ASSSSSDDISTWASQHEHLLAEIFNDSINEEQLAPEGPEERIEDGVARLSLEESNGNNNPNQTVQEKVDEYLDNFKYVPAECKGCKYNPKHFNCGCCFFPCEGCVA